MGLTVSNFIDLTKEDPFGRIEWIWISVDFITVDEQLDAIAEWCHANVQGDWTEHPNDLTYGFLDQNDAMVFLLKWGTEVVSYETR